MRTNWTLRLSSELTLEINREHNAWSCVAYTDEQIWTDIPYTSMYRACESLRSARNELARMGLIPAKNESGERRENKLKAWFNRTH